MNPPPSAPRGPGAPPSPSASVARLLASRAALQQALQRRLATPRLLERLAHDHPGALLGTAALLGAGAVALRPWRWLPRAAVLAPLAARWAWWAFVRPPPRRR